MTKNLTIKIIALLLAFVVWIYVQSGDKTTDRLLTIPLELVGPDHGLAVMTVLPDQVELYVKGPQSRIKEIENARDEGELKARLDLRKAVTGKKSYSLHVVGANLRWMSVNLVPGPKLEVECGESTNKTFTPQRVIIGELEPGTFIELESGLPESLTVTGADTLLNQVDRVIYKLKETDLVGTDTVDVTFLPEDQHGRRIPNLTISPPQAELYLTVRKAAASREVPVVYNLVKYPPAGYTVTDINIDPLFINLEGSSEVLKDITRIETVPIDLSQRTKDFIIPNLELITPNERVRLSQSTVRFDAKVAQKTAVRLFENLTLNWEGGNEQALHYSSEPRTVNVTVTGPIDSVEKLTRDNILPTVDVADLTEGWHENLPVTIKILLPEISLVLVEPNTVKVRVQKREEPKLEPSKESE